MIKKLYKNNIYSQYIINIMVLSVLRKDKIQYNEGRKIDPEDIDHSSFVYETVLFDKDIEIVLGKEKHTYTNDDVVHFSVYLVKEDAPVSRIGVFEIENNRFLSSIDEEDDSIDLEKGELVFFIDEKTLSKYISDDNIQNKQLTSTSTLQSAAVNNVVLDETDYEDISAVDVDDTENDIVRVKIDTPTKKLEKETANDDSLFIVNENKETVPLLQDETEYESNSQKKNYQESTRTTWIEKFIKSNEYDIVDNEGNGDCFFSTLRDAFRYIGKETTVDKLRNILSAEATEEQYENYRILYHSFFNEKKQSEVEIKNMQNELKVYQKRMDTTSNKEENKYILDQLKHLIENIENRKRERNDTNEMLKEFEYMKDIVEYAQFKEFIKSSRFWADTWAISTLEKKLNVKFIILSEEAYMNSDLDSIMKCGQLNDTELEEQRIFTPEYYIIVSYTGNHYTLIEYKKKALFKFKEIPFDIKSLIINKCLERNSGPYYLIPDVRKYKENIGLDANEGFNEEDDEINNDLYDKNTVVMYHSKSDKKPKAGKGSGEQIPQTEMVAYTKLNKLKDWRRKLDDNWPVPFVIDGMRWNSVKHYFLGSQYKKGFPDFYKEFSLDSGSDMSKDVDMAISVNDSGKFKNKVYKSSEIKIDPDFYEIGIDTRHKMEREQALAAKFTQNADLKQVLMETKNAKLTIFKRGKPFITDISLMKLRKSLQNAIN
jgi:hypothetical protein